MTPTRWLIVAFWTGIILIGAFYMFQSVMTPPPPPVPEKHWFPPPLPGSTAPTASANADVRLTHYILHLQPGAMSFTADVVIQNFGQKKATGIEVSVQPYVGNRDTNPKQPGPDEIPAQAGGDPMANVLQSVDFADLGPGETATQTFTLPVRSDADPAQTALKPKVIFQTVNP
jgi:hypothetical protein